MSLHKLSFATINMLEANIAEVIVDNKITISLEMVEELEAFFTKTFTEPFALLVNKINAYQYSFEAMTCMASNELLTAFAVINYDDVQQDPINQVLELRAMDELNMKVFSGLELGWQEGKNWLIEQLAEVNK